MSPSGQVRLEVREDGELVVELLLHQRRLMPTQLHGFDHRAAFGGAEPAVTCTGVDGPRPVLLDDSHRDVRYPLVFVDLRSCELDHDFVVPRGVVPPSGEGVFGEDLWLCLRLVHKMVNYQLDCVV